MSLDDDLLKLADEAEAEYKERGGEPPEPELQPTPGYVHSVAITGGFIGYHVRETIAALKAAEVGIYNRGGALVRPVRIETPEPRGAVRRSPGAIVLKPVDPEWLRLRMAQHIYWVRNPKPKPGQNEPLNQRRVDPPTELARLVAQVPDEGDWPPLIGVVRHPLLHLDGQWIGEPGYHDGFLLDFEGEWPEPSERREDAQRALDRLKHHLRYFPWAGEVDCSVALSMLIAAVMRQVLSAAPMHSTDAPAPGSGKSLLVDAASILATGTSAAVVDYGRDPVEFSKRLDGMLLAGDSMILIDNVETPLEGSDLCQTLTQPTRRVRPLGASIMVNVPCSAMICATGNNLVLRGDIVRRSLVARIDPKQERPELRSFDQDLRAETIESRAELVAACQTIVRAFIAHGGKTDLSPLGSFDDWSRTVRAALVWLGLPDPAEAIERSRQLDPKRESLLRVLTEWYRVFGNTATTARDVVSAGVGSATEAGDPMLREALSAVAERRGALNTAALGYWLRDNVDARLGGYVLSRDPADVSPARWIVDRDSGEPRGEELPF